MSVGYNSTVQTLPKPLLWIFSHTLYNSFSWLYDYLFCGAVILWLGPIKGGLILTVTTAIVDYYTLKIYTLSSTDLLGIEYIRSYRTYDGNNFFKRIFKFILTKTPIWLQIIVLTPKSNAFLTTALLREEGHTFANMTKRDWAIFWGSFICSQIYWISILYLGIEGIQGLIAFLNFA